MRSYYVYILTSRSGRLYIGMTSNLQARIYQHKKKLTPGFTSKYNIDRLVYVEEFSDVHDAMAREHQLKGWRRDKKIALFEKSNPHWLDLSAPWFDDDS